jgi:hypothetical protein
MKCSCCKAYIDSMKAQIERYKKLLIKLETKQELASE